MNRRAYHFLGWLVWRLGSQLVKFKYQQNRTKIRAAGVVALGLVGGVLAARSGSDGDS